MKHCYLTPTHADSNTGYDAVISNVLDDIFAYDDMIYEQEGDRTPEYYRLLAEYITDKSYPLIIGCKDYDHIHFRKIARFYNDTANQTWSQVIKPEYGYEIINQIGSIDNGNNIIECGKPLELYTREYLGSAVQIQDIQASKPIITVTMNGRDITGECHSFGKYKPQQFSNAQLSSAILIPCVTGDVHISVTRP